MNKLGVYIIFAVIAIQSLPLLAKPAEPEKKSAIGTLAEDARNVFKSFSEASGLANLSAEKVIVTIDSDAKKVASNIDSYLKRLQKEVEHRKPDIQRVMNSLQEELAKTPDSLKRMAGADATAKAEELKKSFEKTLDAAMEPIKKVVKAVQPDAEKLKCDLEASAKDAYNSMIISAKKVEGAVRGTVDHVRQTLRK